MFLLKAKFHLWFHDVADQSLYPHSKVDLFNTDLFFQSFICKPILSITSCNSNAFFFLTYSVESLDNSGRIFGG